MKKILLVFLLAFAPASQAYYQPVFPVEVTLNSTTVLFYFWGYTEAQHEISITDYRVPLRQLVDSNRRHAEFFRENPIMFAYLWGRADAFAREADWRGER